MSLCGFRAVLDEDTPGGGAHYCISCSRYFVSDDALEKHAKTKPHKRRYAWDHDMLPGLGLAAVLRCLACSAIRYRLSSLIDIFACYVLFVCLPAG